MKTRMQAKKADSQAGVRFKLPTFNRVSSDVALSSSLETNLDSSAMATHPIKYGLANMSISVQPFRKNPPNFTDSLPIQAQLTIDKANDKYELEANQIARKVVQRINRSPISFPVKGKASKNELRNRQEDETQPGSLTYAKTGSKGFHGNSELETEISQMRGKGQPLHNSILAKMENAFHSDFGDVRIHTNSRANQLNKLINSQAFTTGKDIFFRRGMYTPNSTGGQHLIAHELAHVEQQRQGCTLIQRASLVNANHMHPSGRWQSYRDAQNRVYKIEANDLKLNQNQNSHLPGKGHNSPTAAPSGWLDLQNLNLTHPNQPPNYVRMHLLNGQLGGPGNNTDNLAPGTASLNSHHLKNLEDEVLKWITSGGEITNYVVEIKYNSNSGGGNLITPTGRNAWNNTIKEITGDFEFEYYSGNKRKKTRSQPFEAIEDPGLETKPNWAGN